MSKRERDGGGYGRIIVISFCIYPLGPSITTETTDISMSMCSLNSSTVSQPDGDYVNVDQVAKYVEPRRRLPSRPHHPSTPNAPVSPDALVHTRSPPSHPFVPKAPRCARFAVHPQNSRVVLVIGRGRLSRRPHRSPSTTNEWL